MPMDRIVGALDDLLERGELAEDVIIQAAAFRQRPQHARAVDIVAYDVLEAWIRQARHVVTHGGPGAIMQALAAGKRPIVVPRDPRLGEHVDDHQIRFVQWLAARRPVTPVWEIGNLGPLLRQEPQTADPPEASVRAVVARRLIDIVECDRL